jgi:DNA-binding GntR family transcriptional regulator
MNNHPDHANALHQKEKFVFQLRKTLGDEIKDYLINAITSGVYQPGDRIIETRLASTLNVSQGAVREALHELEWMGFLEITPFSGTRIKEHTVKDLRDIYPVRAELEALGARLATPLISNEQLEEMEHLIAEMVHSSELGNERGMVENNYAFHKILINASNNPVLIRCWSMFQFSYWTAVSTAKLHDDMVYLSKRHYVILEALKARDPELASEAIKTHLIELIKLTEERNSEQNNHSSN